jgi:hypothetical protein
MLREPEMLQQQVSIPSIDLALIYFHISCQPIGLGGSLAGLERAREGTRSTRALGDGLWLVTRCSTLKLLADVLNACRTGSAVVAVSPKLLLMPARSLPLEALTFLIETWRLALSLQLPQER